MERRIVCTLSFVAGLLLPMSSLNAGVALLVTLGLLIIWRKPLRTPLSCALIALSLLAGLARVGYDLSLPAVKLPARGEVAGTILEPPRRWGRSSVFFFSVEELNGKQVSEPFKVLVQWRGCDQNAAPGDRWILNGRFGPGERAAYPGSFDQRDWLWCQRAQGVLMLHRFSGYHYLSPPRGRTPRALAYRAREWMMRRLARVSGERERALVAGVVFGETQSLPRDLQDHFRRTGTSHLLAASGMNVALLAGLILGCGRLAGLAPWRVASAAIPPVVFYAFLAGCGPSITRAAIGTSFALLAMILGRKSSAWNTLSLSVWLLLLWDPRQLYDLGFQLSVAAVVGLGAGPEAPKKWGYPGSALVLTTSACIVTLPIFWSTFGELSTTLLPANLILGPIVETLFPLGLLASVLPLAPLCWVVEKIATVSLFLVSRFSELSDPIQLAPLTPAGWTILALTVLCWYAGRHWGIRLLALPLVLLAWSQGWYAANLPIAEPHQIVVRRVGLRKPVFWVSLRSKEMLIVSEEWQESRARSMMRKLGCLREPELHHLPPGETLDLQWKRFRWREVESLLPGAPYTELIVGSDTYKVRTWSAE